MEPVLNFLLDKKKEMRNEIWDTTKYLGCLKNELEQINNRLAKLCVHDWIADTSLIGEHTTYICQNCQLHNGCYIFEGESFCIGPKYS